ncbi:MAG: RDD family protein [Treponema sp.]|nr:RDD family protein [Treponema sp.]MCL2272855.1 RDD family protein [Treponema sp.]
MGKTGRFDTSLEALTPEGVKFILIPAGFPVRTLAYAIDKVTQWIILLVISIAGNFLRNATGIWVILILNFLVDWFYHIICELSFKGQSLGKYITGIRVIKNNGAPVDPASSFMRNLLRFADTFFFLFPIALISIAASSGFRRLGDWAGNTLVVYKQKSSRQPRDISGLLARCDPVIPQIKLSNDEKQAILNFARSYHLLGESRANEIAGIYAPYLKENDRFSDSAFLLGIARSLSGENSLKEPIQQ